MIIAEEDFKLYPVVNSACLFDLELLYIVKAKSKDARKEFKNCGYGITLEHAIKKIIIHRINNKYDSNSIISLKQYIKDYKQEYNKIEYLVNAD